jgi:hypothetical protein
MDMKIWERALVSVTAVAWRWQWRQWRWQSKWQ